MTQQERFTIKKGKIRGQESHGMICAEDELGLEEAIMILDDPMLQEQKRQRYLK
jgi:phenylalanyl-tRNA synthetase beta chain